MQGQINEVLFSGLDMNWHDRQRRLLTSAFSMSQMVKYESCVNDNINLFIEQLHKRFAATGAAMDVMEWATYWSLEVIYDLTFGERAGYVEEGKDVNGVISGIREMDAWWLYVSEG